MRLGYAKKILYNAEKKGDLKGMKIQQQRIEEMKENVEKYNELAAMEIAKAQKTSKGGFKPVFDTRGLYLDEADEWVEKYLEWTLQNDSGNGRTAQNFSIIIGSPQKRGKQTGAACPFDDNQAILAMVLRKLDRSFYRYVTNVAGSGETKIHARVYFSTR